MSSDDDNFSGPNGLYLVELICKFGLYSLLGLIVIHVVRVIAVGLWRLVFG